MMKIKLMADYECFPLWNTEDIYNVDPRDLPLSDQLISKLLDWSDEFDTTLNVADPRSSGFKSDEALARFNKEGYELYKALQFELRSSAIVAYSQRPGCS